MTFPTVLNSWMNIKGKDLKCVYFYSQFLPAEASILALPVPLSRSQLGFWEGFWLNG